MTQRTPDQDAGGLFFNCLFTTQIQVPRGLRHERVGRCEHLDWPGDIEQLDGRIGQDFDNAVAVWRKARGFWHHERDEIGPDLVPDYLTSVKENAFYGWPYSYFGQQVDVRVQPQRPAWIE